MRRKLVILTEIIAPYRIPVFNALARQAEIDLHVMFLSETDPSLRQWRVYKEEIEFSYEVLSSWRRRLGKYNAMLNWGLGTALRRASPNVILCGGYNYLASWHAMAWARRHGAPFLAWVESTSADLRRRRALVESLKRNFMRRCDGFVVPGKSSTEYVRNYGVPEGKIFTAPNAVDVEFFGRRAAEVRKEGSIHRRTLSLSLPARFFLFVGRLVREKGVFDLLDAYGTLGAELRSEIGLVFAGDGVARPELERRAARITPGAVHFAGFTQREQLPSYYGLAEMLVFPTHSDTWGLVVNEAMACGLPVITTSTAGCTADLVQDGWNGRVVRAGDVGDLARAMREMATQPEVRTLMGQRSAERILGYLPETCASGIAQAVLGLSR
ncbi:MAG: glycosyltransferase family 4 protein [Acidobacteriia bacterium]|nr:glycosyltransferase family 4 protein [Terriglobia bacterium]